MQAKKGQAVEPVNDAGEPYISVVRVPGSNREIRVAL